jgi:hypothetical protein
VNPLEMFYLRLMKKESLKTVGIAIGFMLSQIAKVSHKSKIQLKTQRASSGMK